MGEFHARFSPRRRADRGVDYYAGLVESGLAEVALYEDSLPTLARARSMGLRLALLSNLAKPYARPIHEFGLAAHFDVLVLSCDVGMAKPSAGIYAHTCAALGLAADQLLMIGDTLRDDVRGARRAGLHALHLDREGGRGDLGALEGLFEHPLLRGLARVEAGAAPR
nr:HAD family hydrolase [Pseudenhygromyxa sp. WMMC2535]